MNKRDNIVFGLTNFISFAAYSVINAFIVLYLDSMGYNGTEIGLITSLTMVLCIIAQPLSAYVVDHYLSAKKLVIINMCASAVSIALMFFFSLSIAAVFIAFLVYSMSGRYIIALMDVYVTKLAKTRSGLDYGIVRGLGSAGYAITALVTGRIIASFGFDSMLILHTVFAVLTIPCVLLLPDMPLVRIQKDAGKGRGFLSILGGLLKKREYTLAVTAFLLVFSGHIGVANYFPIHLINSGGTEFHNGLCIFLLSFVEIPTMLCYPRLLRRFTDEQMLAFSLFMVFAKMTVQYLFTNIWLMLAAQLIQAFSFGLFIPSVVRFLSKMLSDEEYSVGIMVQSITGFGINIVVGNYLGGYLMDKIGIISMFHVCSAITLAGALLFLGSRVMARKVNGH